MFEVKPSMLNDWHKGKQKTQTHFYVWAHHHCKNLIQNTFFDIFDHSPLKFIEYCYIIHLNIHLPVFMLTFTLTGMSTSLDNEPRQIQRWHLMITMYLSWDRQGFRWTTGIYTNFIESEIERITLLNMQPIFTKFPLITCGIIILEITLQLVKHTWSLSQLLPDPIITK